MHTRGGASARWLFLAANFLEPRRAEVQLPRITLLGPSVSRDRLRSELRIRDQHPEHRVRDAPLEAAHRLPARLALRQLFPMIRSAARIAASLADSDHMHDLVETAVAGKREPVADHLATGSFDRRHACIRSEVVSLAREARDIADYSQDLRCQDRPQTKISVSMVP